MALSTAELEAIALENCDKDPLHLVGETQTFGCLVAMTVEGTEFLHVASNCAEYFGMEPEEMLSTDPRDVFGSELLHDLRNIVGRSTSTTQREIVGQLENEHGTYSVAVHRTEDIAIIELTDGGETPESRADGLTKMRWFTSQLNSSLDIPELLDLAVEHLRAISGYDRVMAYRFRPDNSGEVVAESAAVGIGSFLHLRFPEFDIPPQARQLYVDTPIRIIGDIQQDSIPLVTKHGHGPLDLSLAILRGTVPVHQQYLSNMGVGASLTLPIVVDGKLWGLFAFHHHSPRHVGNGMDHVLEFLGRYLILVIEAALERQLNDNQYRAIPLANSMLSLNVEGAVTATSLRPILAEMLLLVPSAGVAYLSGSMLVTYGDCPPESAIEEVRDALDMVTEGVTASDCLQEKVDPSRLGGVAGALSIEFGTSDGGSLIFFRKEASDMVRWAGSPEKTLDLSNGETRLTPRASFGAFEELMEGRSDSWEHSDIASARGLQRAVRTAIPVLALSADRDALVDNLELVVQELNHRVRNILALVQSIIRQSAPPDRSLTQPFDALEKRILSLATAHNLLSESAAQSLSVEDAFASEAAPYGRDRLTTSGPAVAISAEAAPVFVLVIHEMFSNAAKHGALSADDGRLEIDWSHRDDGLHIVWTETGGPLVTAPSTTGFGLNLIKNALSFEYEGRTKMDFAPNGLRVEVFLPTAALASEIDTDVASLSLASDMPVSAPTTLEGNVLLVEDDFLISMQTNDELTALGAAHVFTASKNTSALEILKTKRVDFGIVDINLGNEWSGPVARRLTELKIPFIFVTGYDSGVSFLEGFDDVAVLRKPVSIGSLRTAIDTARTGSSSAPQPEPEEGT